MKARIKRIDSTLPLPAYQTKGSVAFDLASREQTIVPAHGIVYAPLNVIVRPPAGHMLLLAPRSSLHKRGLMFANSVGIGDEDFCGETDEYRAALYNFTDKDVVVEKGDRIAQGMFVPIVRAEWEEVESMDADSRGGFGSTGK